MNTGIDRIEIEGFKSIKHGTILLNSLNIFIGANGSGKSNFIEIFKLLKYLISRDLDIYVGIAGGANHLLHFGRKHTPCIRLNVDLNNMTESYKCILSPNDNDNLYITNEQTINRSRSLSNLELNGDKNNDINESLFDDEYITYEHDFSGSLTYAIEDCRIYHFQDTSREAGVKQMSKIHDNRILKTDAANLASFLYLLKKKNPANYKRIVETVRLAAPYFDDFFLEPLALNSEMIRLEWREKGSEHIFGPSALSDGTLRFICLATALLQPKLPSTLLIDEPELGLHPYAITLLAELFREAALHTQVIVSTQSVTLVNQFEPRDIIVVEREESQTVFKRLDEAQIATWLEDYGLGDLWEKNLLGGRP